MPFSLPRLSKCCCCVPLRIGSLIIGYISILMACLSLGMISYSLYRVVTIVRDGKVKPPSPEVDLSQEALHLYISHAYYLLVFTFLLVISLMLVIGVHTNKPKYLRYYFNSGLFLLGLALALVVVTCVFVGILFTLPLLKWCLIHFFTLLVIRSTYLEMEEENNPPAYQLHNMQVYNPQQTVPLMA